MREQQAIGLFLQHTTRGSGWNGGIRYYLAVMDGTDSERRSMRYLGCSIRNNKARIR